VVREAVKGVAGRAFQATAGALHAAAGSTTAGSATGATATVETRGVQYTGGVGQATGRGTFATQAEATG
jgi:hypothetical protein